MAIDFLSYAWPINYTAPIYPVSSLHNQNSASQFASHVQDYNDTESSWNAIATYPLKDKDLSHAVLTDVF